MTTNAFHRKLLKKARANGGTVTDRWVLFEMVAPEIRAMKDAGLIARRHTCEGETLREAWATTGDALLEEAREAITGPNWADAVEPLQLAEQIQNGLHDGAWHLTADGWDAAHAEQDRLAMAGSSMGAMTTAGQVIA